jgi:hypothetical protein
MSKWALFAAHRYVRAGAAVPREIGPDGRPLARPWRRRPAAAVQMAQRIRAGRPQPRWPRLVGLVCIAVAAQAALDPVGPMAAHVAASASAGPGPRLDPIVVEAAVSGELPDLRFRWGSSDPARPVTLLVFATDYSPLTSRSGLVGTGWSADPALLEQLTPGQTYHCVLRAEVGAPPVQTPLTSFVIR